MEYCKRPDRSDKHLSKEEEAKLEEETRRYFDSVAPKRHSKPHRSDYSSTYFDSFEDHDAGSDGFIPEHCQFQRLENDPQKLLPKHAEISPEFVETEYYKDLNCVDKQHHTTGTGFITMESSKGNGFALSSDSPAVAHPSGKGNPATNDWIPSDTSAVNIASNKPGRSEI